MPLITGSLYVSGQAVASLICGQRDSDGGGQKALAVTNRLLRCPDACRKTSGLSPVSGGITSFPATEHP